MRRKVENDEVVRAYFGDPRDPDSVAAAERNRSVIHGCFKKYGLVDDEGQTHALHVVWRCLRYHLPVQQFTSSLFRFATWECRRVGREAAARKNRPHRRITGREGFVARRDLAVEAGEALDCLPAGPTREMARMRYLEGMTWGEVGARFGQARETVRGRVARAASLIQSDYNAS